MENGQCFFIKGKKDDVNNYRPVSLLSVVANILDRCVYDNIITQILPKLTDMQHGFLRGRSMTGQLIQVLNKITTILESKNPTNILYFD